MASVSSTGNINNLISSSFKFPSNKQFFIPILKFPNPIDKINLTIYCAQSSSNNNNENSSQDHIKPSVDAPGRKNRPKNRRKPSYGTSRKSVLKKSFSQEQVTFSAPVSNDPVVGIIGGGMAGLICALYLEKRGFRSTVFDTVSTFDFF